MPSKMSKRSKFTTQGHEEMQLQCNKTEKHDKSDWHISHNAHQNAFETLIQYIKDEIVAKKEKYIILQISTNIMRHCCRNCWEIQNHSIMPPS